MVKLVDTRDLKSSKETSCRFKSGPGHHIMKVLFTHDIFSKQKYGGISTYFSEIIKRADKAKIDLSVDGIFHQNLHLNAILRNKKKFVNVRNTFHSKSLYLANVFTSLITRKKYDITHHTFFLIFILKKVKML